MRHSMSINYPLGSKTIALVNNGDMREVQRQDDNDTLC